MVDIAPGLGRVPITWKRIATLPVVAVKVRKKNFIKSSVSLLLDVRFSESPRQVWEGVGECSSVTTQLYMNKTCSEPRLRLETIGFSPIFLLHVSTHT